MIGRRLLTLRVELASFELTPSGTVSGKVWFEADGKSFPEVGWVDLVIAFIGELVEVANRFIEGKDDVAEIRFYDGPFLVRATRKMGSVLLDFSHVGRGRNWQVSTDLVSWVDQVRRTASEVVNHCTAAGWGEVNDVLLLRRRLAAGRE